MSRTNGILNTVYNNNVSVTVSSVWHVTRYYYLNKAENLLNFSSCQNCRWWSQSIPNSFVIFSFNKELIVASYSLQSTVEIYPTSWKVYYSLDNDDDWRLLDFQRENKYLNAQFKIKKFRVSPTLVKKIKIEQLESFNNNNNGYLNCFALKRVEFFGKDNICTLQLYKAHTDSLMIQIYLFIIMK